MSAIVVVSILLQILALAWSLAVMIRSGDRRVLILSAMLLAMVLHSAIGIVSRWSSDMAVILTWDLDEVPLLILSLMAFWLVLNLEGLLGKRLSSTDTVDPRRELPVLPVFAIGLVSILAIVLVSILAYQRSREAIRTTVARANLVSGRSVCGIAFSGMPQLESSEALDRLLQTWEQTDRAHENSYLCVIGPDGKLRLHSRKPEMVGMDVGNVVVSPDTDKTVRSLLRDCESWSGQNTNFRGNRQLVGYHYEPALRSLVAVHVPVSEVDAEFRSATTPWIVGMAVIGGLFLPGSLGLLFYSSLRSSARARRSIAELSKSEERFRSLVDAFPNGVQYNDLEGRITYSNPAHARIQGCRPEQLVGMSIWDFEETEQRREALKRQFADIVDNQPQPTPYVTTNRTLDGRIIDAEILWSYDRDAGGNLKGFISIVSDVTETKAKDDALRESEERYRAIVETSGEGIYLCEFDTPMPIDLPEDEQIRRLSTDCYFAVCNDAFARMYGYESGDQMVGKRAIDTYGTHDNQANQDFLRKLVRSGYRVNDEVSEEFDREENRVVFANNCLGIVEDGHLIRVWGAQRDITAQTLAARKLADSENRFRQLVANSPYCIHEVELDGRVSSMNPAGLALIGASAESEVRGKVYLDFVTSSDRALVAQMLEQACSGRTVHFEFKSPGGAVFESSLVPLFDDEGEVKRLMGISNDVSDKKRAEILMLSENAILEAIAKGQPQEETLQNLMSFIESQSNDVIASLLVLDEDGKHLRHAVSSGLPESYVRAIDGVAIGPAVGSCGTSAYSGEPVFVDDIATDPRWQNYRQLAADYGLAACWSMPVKDHVGRLLGTLAIYRKQPGPCGPHDRRLIEIATHLAAVTISHHRSEAALRQSEERFRMMFEQAAVGVALLESASGVILQVNRRYCEILGMQQHELVGKTWMELTHPDDLEEDSRRMSQLRDGQVRDFAIEKRLRRKDDTYAWINLSVSGMWQPGDAPSTHIAIVEDITQRKQAEEEIQKHREMIAHVTRLSTMGELMAGIAHEVKQPLYAISNFATAATVTLRDLDGQVTGDSEWLVELKEWNRGVRDASLRASEIIERLRDFARRDEGSRAAIDVNQAVRDSVDLVAFEARKCDAELELSLDPSLPGLVADRIQCEQVVVNLLHNAYEALASTPKPRRVWVRTCCRDAHVEIIVKDSGPGIRPDQHGKLFNAFYTTKPDGMGMGLAISRTIVEDHGGRLWIEETETGAEFHVQLPLASDSHSREIEDARLQRLTTP